LNLYQIEISVVASMPTLKIFTADLWELDRLYCSPLAVLAIFFYILTRTK
jgi:hypothetical protein